MDFGQKFGKLIILHFANLLLLSRLYLLVYLVRPIEVVQADFLEWICYSVDNNFQSEHVKGVCITTVLFMKTLYWQWQQHSLN